MREVNMKNIVPVLMLLGLVGCEEPGQKALKDFRAYVAKTYKPGQQPFAPGYTIDCKFTSDVRKTDQVASPFEGILNLATTIHGQETGFNTDIKATVVFQRDGEQWKCDPEKSKVAGNPGSTTICATAAYCAVDKASAPSENKDEAVPEWLKKKPEKH
jgi:hypothetical protein